MLEILIYGAVSSAIYAMLAVGFSVATTDDMGATPLHWAAFTGNVAATRVLLAHGTPVDACDRTYQSNPLGWADYAASNRTNPNGDYPGVARLLIEAGVSLPTEEKLENWGSEEITALVRDAMRQNQASPP